MRLIRVESIPPGTGPDHVREAWVGLVLPVADVPRPAVRTFPVGSLAKRSLWHTLQKLFKRELVEQPTPVYSVSFLEAVGVLEKSNPVAAQWYRANCAHTLQAGYFLGFAMHSCVELPCVQA